MKAQIAITTDGKLTIITQEGTFEQGQAILLELLQTLGVNGLDITVDGPIEQHRHDDTNTQHTHQHAG
jgi:hypothetical protein